MIALKINNVSKKYGNFTALNNVSFDITEGDFVGLLGVNGAGKTTLISSISGVNNFDGSIEVMGHDVIKDVVAAKHNLGVVPQELAYDPFLTVYQTLKFQSGLYGVKNNNAWISEIIERMYLKDKADTNCRALSGGMKRRLMVAQALVHKPPVIILDEPTAGVDVEIRKSLWEFITELHKNGHTILLTTHYLEEVEKLCNKIVMINKGEILAQSSKTDLIGKAINLPTTVELETFNGAFSPALESMIFSREGNTFILKLDGSIQDNSDQLLMILNTLKSSNVRVKNININKPSLEDVFISYLHK
jgi:ABC-2 type transport system ATP-binding protein